MNKIKTFFIVAILAAFAALVFAAAPKMFFSEYRFIHPGIKAGSFDASSRKLWRIGFQYLRLEEAPDPAQNIHGLIISAAPDTYMINRFTKSGRHIVDRSENTDVHISVFQAADLPQTVLDLEMGHENSFFAKQNAQSIGVEIIDGIKCEGYRTTIDGCTLTLYKRIDNGNPLQVSIKKGDIAYDVRYLRYDSNLPPDFKLFEVPQGIQIIDVN